VREEKVNDGYIALVIMKVVVWVEGFVRIRWLFSMMTSMTKLESSMGRIGLEGLD
jgi:hypothetical protein